MYCHYDDNVIIHQSFCEKTSFVMLLLFKTNSIELHDNMILFMVELLHALSYEFSIVLAGFQ
jgi:hypothetical protein